MGESVHPKLPASWWFEKGLVAGSARPGFGALPWMELAAEEAALLSWIGSRQGHAAELPGLRPFLDEYVGLRAAYLPQGTAPLRAPGRSRRPRRPSGPRAGR